MRTIQEIIDNQEMYKNQIFSWARQEFEVCRKFLNSINTQDTFIIGEKAKLENKIKKLNIVKQIRRFFYLENNNNETYYVWWDLGSQEALFLTYD